MQGLTAVEIDRYQQDGVLCPIRLLSSEEAAHCRSKFEEIMRLRDDKTKRIDNLHLFLQWARDLSTHPRLMNLVESMLGDDLIIAGTLVFCKYPHDPGFAAWHQDSYYSNWHLTPSVSAWIALSESNSDNGCMRVIPGSHQRGVLPHGNAPSAENLLHRGEQLQVEIDESQAVDLVLKPGEMSFHHANIMHGSEPNRTDFARIGFIVRFVTSQIEAVGVPVLRARGNGDCSHLDVWNRAPVEGTVRGLADWEEFNLRRIATSKANA